MIPAETRPRFNSAYAATMASARLTIGLFFAIDSYPGAVPDMDRQLELAVRAEELGFSALWTRDVPVHDTTFGDVGQVYDPYVWLGHVSAVTKHIALGTAGLVLPLRHPVHVAKAIASVEQLTRGRMIAGVSSGDRFVEYPLFGASFDRRGADFRSHATSVRRILDGDLRHLAPHAVEEGHAEPIPIPSHGSVPLLAIGSAQQPLSWIAENMDGFVTYPRPVRVQAEVARAWRQAVEAVDAQAKPFAQSLYVDLVETPTAAPTPIHLGLRAGTEALTEELLGLESIGVSHIMLNLKYGRRPAAEVMEHIAEEILPSFGA